jgi:hypothetical protein
MQAVRGEAAPALLILEFVEGVLRVSPITVELARREDFVIEVGDQHVVLIPGDALGCRASPTPSSSEIADSARHSVLSLITLFIPKRGGLTLSQRIVVTCE